MISDLGSQWPVLAIVGPLILILAVIIGWFVRHTVNQVNRRIEKQDDRIRDMVLQMTENEDKHNETARELARLQERHAALKEKVDTGFDFLQRRLEHNIERFMADTSSTFTEVRLIMRDLPDNEQDSSEELPNGPESDAPPGT